MPTRTKDPESPPRLNQRKLERLRRITDRSHLHELLDWYERFKPTVREVRVYPELLEALLEYPLGATFLGWRIESDGYPGHPIGEPRLSIRGFRVRRIHP